MKLLLLKILLQRRDRDEGYTLPMVIALGLVMILLGAVNILSAGEENLNALSDNQKNEALAIAEIGVTRYRELLDTNRMLAVNSSDAWSSITNTCDTNDTITERANTAKWHDVDDGTGSIGEYRIVSYIYDIDGDLNNDDNGNFASNDDNLNDTDIFDFNDTDNTYEPKGVLTVKSKAADGSEAQVRVEIPIRINEGDMKNLLPALWLGSADASDFGNLKLGTDNVLGEDRDGNIVLSRPATESRGCQDPDDIGTGDVVDSVTTQTNVISDARALPEIVDADTLKELDPSEQNSISGDLDLHPNYDSTNQESLLGVIENPEVNHKLWKEQTWNNGQSTNFYFYKTSSALDINNQRLTSDGSARVVLYVNDDISLSNEAILDAGGRYASSILLEIYGTENTNNITLEPNGNDIDITALIHAPDATVKVKGSGGTVNIKGAMWVKDWKDESNGSVEVTITPDNAGFGSRKSFEYYLGTDNRAAKPITDAPTNWEVQEVQADQVYEPE